MKKRSRKETNMKDQILKAIENNAKLTAKDLAAMLGVDEAAVAATIRELEADSVICGKRRFIK